MQNICIKCGGTGVTFEGKKCDCGVKMEIDLDIDDIEKHIPLIYRGSENVGKYQNLRNLEHISLENIINRIVEGKLHQSILIDLSGTNEGAYNVYYKILEDSIRNNNMKLPENLKNYIMVNQILKENLESYENKVFQGNWTPLIIITDYGIERYEGLRNYIKILNFGKFINKAYPLNIYHMKFDEK